MTKFYRADSIIEVMIAIAIFGLVAISALSIMSGGLAQTQRTMESTLVRQEMDSQAATLRFLHTAFITSYTPGSKPSASTPAGQWYSLVEYIKASGVKSASTFGPTESGTCPGAPVGSFILNAKKATIVTASANLIPATLQSKVNYDMANELISSEGLWVEGVRSVTSSDTSQSQIGFIDFHIRACWDSVGQAAPMTLGTIVRLYDPR